MTSKDKSTSQTPDTAALEPGSPSMMSTSELEKDQSLVHLSRPDAETHEHSSSHTFRPRARLLKLMGEQLIGSDRLAVFELVKNAYDADASKVVVTLNVPDTGRGLIIVADDGEGMSLQTITDIWLVPGSDHREKQRQADRRTAKFGRLPLGEKGIGRFAVYKLGDKIELVTRAKGQREVVVAFDWKDLSAKDFLDDAKVAVVEREPEVFTGETTGTRITVSKLRRIWTRGDVRRLWRNITAISSPFDAPSDFRSLMVLPGREDWLTGMHEEVTHILERAMWHLRFSVTSDGKASFEYRFTPIPELRRRFGMETRSIVQRDFALTLPKTMAESGKVVVDFDFMRGIGPVHGEFHVFDRDRRVLDLMTETQLLKGYLDEHGGVRVYRDGIRVYNYGEQSDDWLGLDLRRVQTPTRNISRNLVIGAVHLSLSESLPQREDPDGEGLVEKTSREGFIENDTYSRLQKLALALLWQLEVERRQDKDRIRTILSNPSKYAGNDVSATVAQLRTELDSLGLLAQFEARLKSIERSYNEVRQLMLKSGLAGLNLSVVFHEVERGVRELQQSFGRGEEPEVLQSRVQRLSELLDGFAALLRQEATAKHSLRTLAEHAVRLHRMRMKWHDVDLQFAWPTGSEGVVYVNLARNLLLGSLSNAIDNALYWLRVRWPVEGESQGGLLRRLYVGLDLTSFDGPALIVADNGPGFSDLPSDLVRPFWTRKDGGMGLGLYYANSVMELSGGSLEFPAKGTIAIPEHYDGAVVAFVFPSEVP